MNNLSSSDLDKFLQPRIQQAQRYARDNPVELRHLPRGGVPKLQTPRMKRFKRFIGLGTPRAQSVPPMRNNKSLLKRFKRLIGIRSPVRPAAPKLQREVPMLEQHESPDTPETDAELLALHRDPSHNYSVPAQRLLEFQAMKPLRTSPVKPVSQASKWNFWSRSRRQASPTLPETLHTVYNAGFQY